MPQTLREGFGDIARIGTVVSCSLAAYILDPPAANTGEQGKEDWETFGDRRPEPAEASPFEQFQIGEGDAVPGNESEK